VKTKKFNHKIAKAATEPAVLRDAAAPGLGRVVTVRDAKAHLSALLEWVSAGNEVTIISAGEPKARLVGARPSKVRKVFTGLGDHLESMPMQTEGPFADELVRADRDGRGW
jgi:prevent-host-death family protein